MRKKVAAGSQMSTPRVVDIFEPHSSLTSPHSWTTTTWGWPTSSHQLLLCFSSLIFTRQSDVFPDSLPCPSSTHPIAPTHRAPQRWRAWSEVFDRSSHSVERQKVVASRKKVTALVGNYSQNTIVTKLTERVRLSDERSVNDLSTCYMLTYYCAKLGITLEELL